MGRARALQTVLRVAGAVASASSLTDLAGRFAAAVAVYTRFPAVVVLRLVPEEANFVMLAQHGFDESKFPPTKALPAKGSLTGLAAERRAVTATEDLTTDDRLDADTRVALTANAYSSGVCAPVMYGDEVLGSFNLVYPRGTSLALGERRMLETLASSLGVAMAHQIAIARERELEAQARRAQQLESLGRAGRRDRPRFQQSFDRHRWDAFLQKPYTIDELSAALQHALAVGVANAG